MPTWIVSSLLAFENNTVEINKTENVFLFRKVYLQAKFFQVRSLGQRVNTYAIALRVVKFPFLEVGFWHIYQQYMRLGVSLQTMPLDFSQSEGWEMAFQWSFSLRFLYSEWDWASFPVFEDLRPSFAMNQDSCPFYLNFEELFKMSEISPLWCKLLIFSLGFSFHFNCLWCFWSCKTLKEFSS